MNATRFCDTNGVQETNASCAFNVLDLEDVSVSFACMALGWHVDSLRYCVAKNGGLSGLVVHSFLREFTLVAWI